MYFISRYILYNNIIATLLATPQDAIVHFYLQFILAKRMSFIIKFSMSFIIKFLLGQSISMW